MNIRELQEHAIQNTNIAEDLDEEILNDISSKCCKGYELDEESRAEWKEKNDAAIGLAMQLEDTNQLKPDPNAPDVKYPLISTACLQFSSRVMPNVVNGTEVVKSRVVGNDKSTEKARRAERVSEHMSYQCLEEMEEWLEDMDKGFTSLPVLGVFFKKTSFNPLLKRNVSELVYASDLVVHYYAKNLESAARITHQYELSPNDIVERQRGGFFLDVEIPQAITASNDEDNRVTVDPEAPRLFLEQHTWLDLDDDGYQEPYIVTINKDSKKIYRIAARFDADGIKFNSSGDVSRINPVNYFTMFPFMHSVDGSFYPIGWGHLLAPLNKTANMTINQLLWSGNISSAQSGFLGRGLQLGRNKMGGTMKIGVGEWKPIQATGDDIRKNVFPLPTKEPSVVLFQLLGMMIESGERLASVSDVLLGESPGQDVPATTTLALIEQGLQVFGAIYLRIYRSLKSEYKKLYRLNRLYLKNEDYFNVLDQEKAIARKDYEDASVDIVPAANPTDVTNTQQLVKAQGIMSLIPQGLINPQVATRRYLEALKIPDIPELMNMPEQGPSVEQQIELEKSKRETFRMESELLAKKQEIVESKSRVIKNIADAESKEEGTQIAQYKAISDSLKGDGNGQNRGTGMAGTPANQGAV